MNGITLLRATFGAHLADFLESAPPPARSGPSRAGPIVLVHGFAGWSQGLLPLERYLRAATGREVVRLRLGAGFDGIEPLAQRAAASIERIAAEWRGRAVDVVGHSMGGLVATYAAKHPDRSARVRRIVTLGTPHRGTALALSGARVLGRVAASLAQMVPGCAFLADLDRAPLPDGVSLVSVAGLGDLVVPAPCARLPRRARHHNRSLADADHWGLVYDAPAQALIARLLRGTPLAPLRSRRCAPPARRIRDGRDRLRLVE
jgi:pimeloyl-ACP methyl ester carboxylesterase